ncbi:MAG: penicillin-binding protein 2 [Chloroflexi bacterium]|nr:penicillin-binding protein 2 [Chloroflexota bacterium]
MTEGVNRVAGRRLTILWLLLLAVLGVFIARLFNLQILQGSIWAARAQENMVEILNLPAPRGVIYDRGGRVLARNAASYNITLTAAYLPDDPGFRDALLEELADLLDMPLNLNSLQTHPYVPCRSELGLRQLLEYGEVSQPYRPVRLKCDVPKEVALVVEEKAAQWPGIGVEVVPVRDYPTGRTTAAIVGFLGPVPEALVDYYEEKGLDINRDKVGYAGLEMQYQDLLAGQNGRRVVAVDVAGRILHDLEPPRQPQPGVNLRLTLDLRLQNAALGIVENELDRWNAYFGEVRFRNAVAIALNPQTGEVLAMVSVPTYDNQRLARFIPYDYYKALEADEFKPLLNHAISAEHPPGSVFKLVTATAGLNEGVVRPGMIIETPGTIELTEKYFAGDRGTGRKFYDWNWKSGGFGQLEFLDCIAFSSNVCFYKVGGGYFDEIPNGGVGICRLKAYAEALGYGSYTGIDLPGEADGLIPDPTWKRIFRGENWSTGDTYLASVGQGYVLVTPLQMAIVGSTIANGGRVMQPTLVYEHLDPEGRVVRPFQPVVRWDVTQEARIPEFENPGGIGRCRETGVTKTIDPWALQMVREGMRRAVEYGTLKNTFQDFPPHIAVAGKTGSAEYCDNKAQAANRCVPGEWPSHAWTLAYAPYDNPEIVVVAFVYDGTEGAKTAAPIVRRIMEAYFELKAQDAEQ